MANKTIAQLTAAGSAALTNLFEIDDGMGGSFKLTAAQLKTLYTAPDFSVQLTTLLAGKMVAIPHGLTIPSGSILQISGAMVFTSNDASGSGIVAGQVVPLGVNNMTSGNVTTALMVLWDATNITLQAGGSSAVVINQVLKVNNLTSSGTSLPMSPTIGTYYLLIEARIAG